MAVPTAMVLQHHPELFSVTCEVRHLPPWVRARLGQLLQDNSKQWQAVMAAIPCTPPWTPGTPLPSEIEPYPRKYTTQDIRLLEQEVVSGRASSSVGSGIALLLEEWGCSGLQRPTLADLIALLDRCSLRLPAAFLRTELLGETSSDDLTQHFRELDLLAEQREQWGALPASTNVHAPDTTLQFGASVVGMPELDNLLAEQRNAPENNGVSYYPVQSSNDEYDELEKLSAQAENASVTTKSTNAPALRPPIKLDETLPLVPHISYELLQKLTNDFSDLPYFNGGRKIGAGAFGVVYRADTSDQVLALGYSVCGRQNSLLKSKSWEHVRQLAIKKLNFADERVDKQFKLEVEILSQCNHPNILPLEGYSCDGPHWCLIYAFMEHGSLQDRLACTFDAPPLTCTQRLDVGQGTADGLGYLHTFRGTPMIHRDIKSANILLDTNLLPKIGDFGLVRLGGSGTHTVTLAKTTTVFGTSAYMAPEAFRGDVSTKVDTFSYGVLLLELLTGLPPFDEARDGRDLLSHVEESDLSPSEMSDERASPWPAGLPEQLHDLAMLCLQEKKRIRPSMVDVAEMWNGIREKWK